MPTIDAPRVEPRKAAQGQVLRATSDLHLSERTAPYVFAALDELRADAAAHPGVTLLLGDIFEHATAMHMPTFNELRRRLQDWPDNVIVLPGNHDQWGLGPGQNAVSALQGRTCQVIERPTATRLGRFIPYTPPGQFSAVLAALKPGPLYDRFLLPIVWCHHGFRGAYRNAMNRDRDGVSCSAIPARHLVVTGHYHMPQTLGRIIYCGSPYETSFAEEGQTKGWLRWADALADPIPARVPYGNLGAPRHVTVHWTPGASVEPPPFRPSDKVRVKAAGTRAEVAAHIAELDDLGLGGAPVLARREGLITVDVSGKTPRQLAEEWVVARDHPAFSPDELIEFANAEALWES